MEVHAVQQVEAGLVRERIAIGVVLAALRHGGSRYAWPRKLAEFAPNFYGFAVSFIRPRNYRAPVEARISRKASSSAAFIASPSCSSPLKAAPARHLPETSASVTLARSL